MWHLDTNIVVAYLNGNRNIAIRLEEHLPDVGISALVPAELLYGARASARAAQNLAAVKEFAQVVHVANFDQACADTYSHIRLALRKKGRPSGEIDNLIAAVAIANGATLVTHNVKHFADIDELTVEDWLQSPAPA